MHQTEAPGNNGSVKSLVKQLKYSLKTFSGLKRSLLAFKSVIDHIVCSINNHPLGLCRE